MTKEFHTIVYIGRFQPPHNGHIATIKRALNMAGNVIVVIGSANQPRTYKNPFTYEERSTMLHHALEPTDHSYFVTAPVEDTVYNDQAWAANVQNAVEPFIRGPKVGIVGHLKDESSFYLKMFPQWKFIEQELVEPLDASQVRSLYFQEKFNPNFVRSVVPEYVLTYLNDFSRSLAFQQVCAERKFIEEYKKQFAALPYPPVFVTTDAIVIQSGHILLIKRRSEPGKGLWALPGGFLNAKSDRCMEDCMIRELQEETGIKVPEKVLRGNIKANRVFDAVDRSERGRTITHAFHIQLMEGEWALPKIKGADDAEKAIWMPISHLNRSELFEDHYDIIMHFLGR